jgi:hypothetical protein
VVQKDSCLAKLGDRVWHDLNQNGIQNLGEPGLVGVQVILSVIEGNKILEMDTTYTDSTGMYMFNVPAGKYKLTFAKPNPDYAPTPWLRGSDRNVDSDMSPFTMMTEFITVDTGVNRMILTRVSILNVKMLLLEVKSDIINSFVDLEMIL